MTVTKTDPIHQDWTKNASTHHEEGRSPATAAAVTQRLARLEVVDIQDQLVPFLAAGAAEMALSAGIPWRFSADDPPVALLRLIAKVAMKEPHAGGPHTDRLFAELG